MDTRTRSASVDAAATRGWPLAARRAISLRPTQPSQLRITQGRVWVTLNTPHVPRGLDDHVLVAGQTLDVPAGAHLVMEPWTPFEALPARFDWCVVPAPLRKAEAGRFGREVAAPSREFAHAVLDVGVHYRERVDDILEVMKEVAAGLREDEQLGPKILGDLDIAGVQSWDDSTVTLRARLKVVALAQWEVKREFLRRLKTEFDARGHEIPYPQVTLSLARETEKALIEQMSSRLAPRKLSSA